MKKLKSRFLKPLAVALVAVVALTSVVPINADGGSSIYFEESTARGSNALSIIQNNEMFDYFDAFRQESSFVEVYAVASKAVYINETLDGNGNVADSRLMTRNEVAGLKQELNRGLVLVGSDYPPKYKKLTCYLVVYKDNYYDSYDVYTNATWEPFGLYFPGESSPADKGYMAITWGGNGEAFACLTKSFYGTYQNGNNMSSYSLAKSDVYNGYCWQFNETTGGLFASPMDYANAYVSLGKKYFAYEGKVTNVVYTYVHTWAVFTPTITFQVGFPQLFSLGIDFSTSSTKWWDIQMDVGGLWY